MKMNKLIEDETLVLLPRLAREIGLNESIVLHRLYVHLQISTTIFFGGRNWFEQTYEGWKEVFPFWSISTIKRTFLSLRKKGFILIEQHGKHHYDRTNWYSICEGRLRNKLLRHDQVQDDVL